MKQMRFFMVWLFAPIVVLAAETKTFDSSKIKTLDIVNGSGDVKIRVSGSEKTTVTYEKIKFDDKCRFSAEMNDYTLAIKAESTAIFGEKSACQVNIEISAPKVVAVKVKNGSGDVSIRGTKGRVDYKLGSGNLDIYAEVETLQGKAGSGDIVVEGLQGSASIETGSGDVTLAYSQCLNKGEVNMRTGSGDVVMKLPADLLVSVSQKTGSGTVKNEFGNSSNAKIAISMKSGSGDLSVIKN